MSARHKVANHKGASHKVFVYFVGLGPDSINSSELEKATWWSEVRQPEYANVLIISGHISKKIVPEIKKIVSKMLPIKIVVIYGNWAISGGPFGQELSGHSELNLEVDISLTQPSELGESFEKMQNSIFSLLTEKLNDYEGQL